MSHGSRGDEEVGNAASRRNATAHADTVLTTIYAGLVLGVGVLAAVFYLVEPAAEGAIDRSLFRWIWLPLAVVCTIGAGVVRGRASSVTQGSPSALPAALVAWSLAEAQALLAAVGFFLTGDLPLLVAGLVLFIFLMARHRPGVFLSRSG